ncbi:MAG: cbb3-type cytochrome c oxidase subunit I, partial [Acetobacteraceae bacterium]|nr:cbb3-type cytochrome c oxidase subunit I [Acetobacteraceae bacterium]
GGMVTALFGGLHFWWPKITGRMYPEMWGRAAALIIFIGFNMTFAPQYILGWSGMPRRYATYPPEYQVLNVMSSAGASILALGYLLPMFYLPWSLFRGPRAAANPWDATGLEWQVASPPPSINFIATPIVTSKPYDYKEPETLEQLRQNG